MTAKPQKRQNDRNMTEGVIWKELTAFAVPLLVGNLFQQLYNTVDSIVVGNYVGKEALAAVGSVGPIINSLIGFFIGLSAGAGAGDFPELRSREQRKAWPGGTHHLLYDTDLLCDFYDPWCRYDAVYAAPDEHAVRCFR